MIGILKSLFGIAAGEQIGVHEAVRRLNDGALLIDVRERGEFAAGHAPQARHLPLAQARAGHAALHAALQLPTGTREVLLICQSGARSRLAQSALSGADACRYVNVSGGMAAWAAAGLPVTHN